MRIVLKNTRIVIKSQASVDLSKYTSTTTETFAEFTDVLSDAEGKIIASYDGVNFVDNSANCATHTITGTDGSTATIKQIVKSFKEGLGL